MNLPGNYSTLEKEFKWNKVVPGDMVWVWSPRWVYDQNNDGKECLLEGVTLDRPHGTPVMVIGRQENDLQSGKSVYIQLYMPLKSKMITIRVYTYD